MRRMNTHDTIPILLELAGFQFDEVPEDRFAVPFEHLLFLVHADDDDDLVVVGQAPFGDVDLGLVLAAANAANLQRRAPQNAVLTIHGQAVLNYGPVIINGDYPKAVLLDLLRLELRSAAFHVAAVHRAMQAGEVADTPAGLSADRS